MHAVHLASDVGVGHRLGDGAHVRLAGLVAEPRELRDQVLPRAHEEVASLAPDRDERDRQLRIARLAAQLTAPARPRAG